MYTGESFSLKGWALTFLMRGFGLSNKLSIKVGFAFSNKGLKSKDLRFRMKKKKFMLFFVMFNDFRFGLGIFTTHLTYICHNCLCHMQTTLSELPLHNANSVIVIFNVERTFKAYVCQMCGKYAKTKYEIIKII